MELVYVFLSTYVLRVGETRGTSGGADDEIGAPCAPIFISSSRDENFRGVRGNGDKRVGSELHVVERRKSFGIRALATLNSTPARGKFYEAGDR